MISKLTFLVVFAACSLIPSVRPDACEELKSCTDRIDIGPNGTWAYLFLESKPATHVEWRTIRRNVCSSKFDRISCVDDNSCNNLNILWRALEAKDTALMMCEPDGKEYYKRMYTTPGSCLGNRTAYDMWFNNVRFCVLGLQQDLLHATTREQGCQAVTAAMHCDSNYGHQLCGYLNRWVLEQIWKVRVRVQFNECLDRMTFYPMPHPDPHQLLLNQINQTGRHNVDLPFSLFLGF